MVPNASGVEATLEKLNVYREGDFFKQHVDTPHVGPEMFGSLVVCLPVEHSGGALCVEVIKPRFFSSSPIQYLSSSFLCLQNIGAPPISLELFW